MRNDLSGKELIEWARKTRENVWDSDILKETQEGWRNNTANAIIKACEHIERDGVDQERAWLLGGFVEYYVVLIDVVRKLAENSWEVDNDTCWEIHDDFMTRCHTDQWEKTLDKCIKYKMDPTRMYAIAIANAMLRRRRLYSKGLRNVRLLGDGLTVEFELEEGELVRIKADSVQKSSGKPLEDPIHIEVKGDYDGPWCVYKESAEPVKKWANEYDWWDPDGSATLISDYADETEDAGGDILDEQEEVYTPQLPGNKEYKIDEFIQRFKNKVTIMGGREDEIRQKRDDKYIYLSFNYLEVKRSLLELTDDLEWWVDFKSSWLWKGFAEIDGQLETAENNFLDIYCRLQAFIDAERCSWSSLVNGKDEISETFDTMFHDGDLLEELCARWCDYRWYCAEEISLNNFQFLYELIRNYRYTDQWKEHWKRLIETPDGRSISSEYCLSIIAKVEGCYDNYDHLITREIIEKLCHMVPYSRDGETKIPD